MRIPVKTSLIIFIFGVIVPSMDQLTVISVISRLMNGPDKNTVLKTGLSDTIYDIFFLLSYRLILQKLTSKFKIHSKSQEYFKTFIYSIAKLRPKLALFSDSPTDPTRPGWPAGRP